MKIGFYTKLAIDGIRKNKRIYIPYILMASAMVAIYYILAFLQRTDTISTIIGIRTIRFTLNLGGWLLALFSCIFILYTNSFILRYRKKEFGLYNIFGMDKGNIGKVMIWETFIVALISISVGLVAGIACSKFAELGLVHIVDSKATYTLAVSSDAIFMSIAVFAAIFFLQFLNSARQIRNATAISLLRSDNTGEKRPKANVFLGVMGVVLLAIAYFIAATLNEAQIRKAISFYFIAVILVVVGTYITMIAGSVLLCRVLQKNKRYYYKPNHFVPVSSMVYRMKRNGAGLASICILITMVLVMIASTACLYSGTMFDYQQKYPRDILMNFPAENCDALTDANINGLRWEIKEFLYDCGGEPQDDYAYRYANVEGYFDGNNLELDPSVLDMTKEYETWSVYFIPVEDYNAIMSTNMFVDQDEALIYTYRNEFDGNNISIGQTVNWTISDKLNDFVPAGIQSMGGTEASIVVFVSDFNGATQTLLSLADESKAQFVNFSWLYNFNTGLKADKQIEFYNNLFDKFQENDTISEKYGLIGINCTSREAESDDSFSMYGGIFFLGIILSIALVIAAMLIIYYKQITEGFEDQPRYETMKKIGMTKKEIRKNITSQMLTVFFFPLLLAGLHLVFAFPMIQRLLLEFQLSNRPLFLSVTGIVGAFIAVFYIIVYRATANAYYRIVSSSENQRRN